MHCSDYVTLPNILFAAHATTSVWSVHNYLHIYYISRGLNHYSDYATLPNNLFAHLLMWSRQSKHYYLNLQACAHSVQTYEGIQMNFALTWNRLPITDESPLAASQPIASMIRVLFLTGESPPTG